MRKFLISAAVAATALTAAAPAAAQWAQPQGYGYGYNGNYGQVRRLDARIDSVQRQIVRLDRRNILSNREAARLRDDARELERRLHNSARNGLSQREAYNIERGIQRIEYRLQRDARDGRYSDGRDGNRFYRDGNWYDRDRDGLNDRYERDRGTNYDEDRDPD